MPELPEVETMVRGLRPAFLGRIVERIEVHDPFLLQGCDARGVRAARAEGASRGGGAAGKVGRDHARRPPGNDRHPAPDDWRLLAGSAAPRPSTFACRSGWRNPRRRSGIATHGGWARFTGSPAPRQAAEAFARSHGPDALEIRLEDLTARLRRTRRGIKPALMDQKVLAGIGNIYADEILFAARIHPQRIGVAALARRAGAAALGHQRDPHHGDRGRGFQLRRRLSHRPRAGRRVPCPERHVRPRRRALPPLRPADREDQDPRPDRPADVFLPELPAAAAAAKSVVTTANIPGHTEAMVGSKRLRLKRWTPMDAMRGGLNRKETRVDPG